MKLFLASLGIGVSVSADLAASCFRKLRPLIGSLYSPVITALAVQKFASASSPSSLSASSDYISERGPRLHCLVRRCLRRRCLQRLVAPLALASLMLAPVPSLTADDGQPADALLIKEQGVMVSVHQTALRPPALLHVPVLKRSGSSSGASTTEPLRSVTPIRDSDGLAVVELYARSGADTPELTCHTFVRSGDSSGEAGIVNLRPTPQPQLWRGHCRVPAGTAIILVQLTRQTEANVVFGLAIGDAEQTLNNLLLSADMAIVDHLNIARVVMQSYPQNQQARTIFNALSPFRLRTVSRARHRLLDQSLDQFRKQEKHSFGLAMRNGVDGRGYRLQDYLRDYPDGRFSVKARLEIPKRKRALFESLPGWAERRAENVLRTVLLWPDSEQKVDALRKYIQAYPHGRFVTIVRSEIGRIQDLADARSIADQMTAKNTR